jgi:hypothetical protein
MHIRHTSLGVFGAALLAAGTLVAGTGSAQAADCSVHSDKKLWCTNAAGAPLQSSPSWANPASTTVNHLRTTYSWFKCWSTGERHSGGNYTWYYTQGDDNSNWGWVAANYLNTTSTFDANPSAYGLPRCQYVWG